MGVRKTGQKISSRRTMGRGISDKRTAGRRTTGRGTTGRGTTGRRTTGRRASGSRAAGRRTSNRRTAKRIEKKRAGNRKTANQRAGSQRTTQRRTMGSKQKRRRGNTKQFFSGMIILLFLLTAGVCLIYSNSQVRNLFNGFIFSDRYSIIQLDQIPEYSGEAYAVINNNVPYFTEEEKRAEAFETYSDLDLLGRCGTAFACICREIMPTEERGPIGAVRPSGWHTVKYDNIEGRYLYNRCHLIGFQLAGENANEKNLITGTRYLNVVGMLPFEDQVASYVRTTGGHVLYRVTPLYDGNNLVASGVEMEAWSVEDQGRGVCYHVFVYNIQPGIRINYSTGDSWLE